MSESDIDLGIRTYVLRSGRMTEAQRRAIEESGPRFILPFDPLRRLDVAELFGDARPLVAEIGFGMGQATWRIAQENPTTGYLGIEVHRPGVGKLLLDIEREGIQNIRIINHDAVEVFERMIPPASLAGLHIFYPDPWPKKRHQKRRLIREGLVSLLASRLAPGAYIYFVTDIENYAECSLELLTRTAGLRNRYAGFAPRQAWRPETKFELRARHDGREAWELLFERT
ncbi:MAG TPA: tRNA (guanosine(46)-N7)-methyltransferase TrmB [Rectinemataceae bacterium]|nr:tRNA (guanosine(46)-N7)-methyltransferase TrmB [Rectinemataceae bacterium]